MGDTGLEPFDNTAEKQHFSKQAAQNTARIVRKSGALADAINAIHALPLTDDEKAKLVRKLLE